MEGKKWEGQKLDRTQNFDHLLAFYLLALRAGATRKCERNCVG